MVYRKIHGHHSGFFTRQPHEWNIRDFIRYSLKNRKADSSERIILGCWNNTLWKISTCSRKDCCGKHRRTRARDLYQAYHEGGRGSDKAIAQELLRSSATAREPTPSVSRSDSTLSVNRSDPNVNLNVHSMIVNSTVTAPTGNIQHASEGDQSLFSVNDAYSADERLSAQETDEESDGTTPTPNLDDVFRTSYSKFQDELKWKLPSGDTVEDILYKAYDQKSRASVRNSIRNWVVDLGNKEMQALLSATDWEAIKAEVPPLPPVDAQFAQSLVRFSKVTTTAALRQVLETTSYKDRSVEYDEAQHFDAEWVENVIRQFLTLYEHDTLHGQYRERWYDFHVWSIMDRSFLSLPGVTLDRCELTSQSYVLRKNSDRTEISSRMKSGPRLDGILRNNEDDSHEFCAIEGAPTLRGGTISTKWLSDNAKLRKVLRDMMSRLAIVADHERRVVEQLQVFGISTAGLTMQVSRMSHRKGYVCLLVVDGLYHIPKDIQQFKQLLLFLVAFVRVKRAIAESITAFKNRLQGSSTDDEAFLQEIMNAGDANTTNVAKLPRPADSP